MLDVYAAREDPEPGVTGDLVAGAVPGGRARVPARPGAVPAAVADARQARGPRADHGRRRRDRARPADRGRAARPGRVRADERSPPRPLRPPAPAGTRPACGAAGSRPGLRAARDLRAGTGRRAAPGRGRPHRVGWKAAFLGVMAVAIVAGRRLGAARLAVPDRPVGAGHWHGAAGFRGTGACRRAASSPACRSSGSTPPTSRAGSSGSGRSSPRRSAGTGRTRW